MSPIAYNFLMLAERTRLARSLAAVAVATAAMATVAMVTAAPTLPAPPALVVPSIDIQCVEPVATASSECPVFVRVAMHAPDDARIICIAVPDGTTIALARYHTTEAWERRAVFDAGGRLVSPLVDQPYIDRPPSTSIVRPLK